LLKGGGLVVCEDTDHEEQPGGLAMAHFPGRPS